MFYNDVLALFLPFFTTADPLLILEPGAAIISKTASDTVAAIIEGLADWRNNRRLRYWDYETKLQRLFDCYAKLELAFPDQDILSLLSRPEEFTRLTSTEAAPCKWKASSMHWISCISGCISLVHSRR